MKFFIAFLCLTLVVNSYGSRAGKWTAEQEIEVLAYAEQFCGKTTIDVVNTVLNGFDDFEICARKFSREFGTKFGKNLKDENYDDAAETIKETCTKSPQFFDCVNNLKAVLPACFDSKAMEEVEMVIRIVHRIFDYICHKDGERVSTLLNNDFQKCWGEHIPQLEECGSAIYAQYSDYLNKTLNEDKFKVELTKRECDTFDEYHNCVNKHLICEKKEITEIVGGFLVAIKEESNCNKLQNVV